MRDECEVLPLPCVTPDTSNPEDRTTSPRWGLPVPHPPLQSYPASFSNWVSLGHVNMDMFPPPLPVTCWANPVTPVW